MEVSENFTEPESGHPVPVVYMCIYDAILHFVNDTRHALWHTFIDAQFCHESHRTLFELVSLTQLLC